MLSSRAAEDRWLYALRYVCFTIYALFAILNFITRVTGKQTLRKHYNNTANPQSSDWWHHPSDVVGGVAIASIVFYLSYPRHYINHF